MLEQRPQPVAQCLAWPFWVRMWLALGLFFHRVDVRPNKWIRSSIIFPKRKILTPRHPLPLQCEVYIHHIMDIFTQLLHSLPQELYDNIYDEVFTSPVQRTDIDLSYRPPHLLSVNSGSRRQFAKSYYHNTAFIFDIDVILHRWLRGVAAVGDLPLLDDIRFQNMSLLDPCVWRFQGPSSSSPKHRRSAAKRSATYTLSRLMRNLKEDRLELSGEVLKLEQHFRNDDGEEEVVLCGEYSQCKITAWAVR